MSPAGCERRRVAVTGLGCVSPLGLDRDETWRALLDGRSGVRAISRFGAADYPVRIAGEVPGEPDLPDIPPKERRRLDRFARFALAAVREALLDAGLAGGSLEPERTGVAIGSGIGGIETIVDNHKALLEGGPRRVSPFGIPMCIANIASGIAAITYGLRGPNVCHATACASGAHAIGEALRTIQVGDADVMLAGGSEAPVTGFVLAGFARMRALSTRNDEPERASRPFDLERDGFVMAEGAGMLVLEALPRARARGARVYAEFLGQASTADAAHITDPPELGDGARLCMQRALADAGIAPERVGYINAHGTSTPVGDRAEARAIRAVFGAHAERVAVSSTKSATGHLLGGSGGLEAVFTAKALETGWLPPTLNLDHPDPECALDHVAHEPRRSEVDAALSNSFGFGGTNCTLVLGRSAG